MARFLALCLAAVALGAGGCGGGDDKGNYADDVREVGQKLQDSSVGTQLQNVKSPQQLAKALREAADLLDEAADDLEEVEPPDEVAAAHEKLTQGARETSDAFRRVADHAEAGDQQDVLGSLNELVSSGGAKKLEEGLNELENKGYDVQDDEGEE